MIAVGVGLSNRIGIWDSNGIHKITMGTKESWKKHLKDGFKISADDSAI